MDKLGEALATAGASCCAELLVMDSDAYFLAVKRKKSLQMSSACIKDTTVGLLEACRACTCLHQITSDVRLPILAYLMSKRGATLPKL